MQKTFGLLMNLPEFLDETDDFSKHCPPCRSASGKHGSLVCCGLKSLIISEEQTITYVYETTNNFICQVRDSINIMNLMFVFT